MPVILEAKDFEQWEKGSIEEAAALMRPAPDDDGSLIAIEGSVATSDEVMAATMALARELGQFDTNDFPCRVFPIGSNRPS